MSSSDGGAIVAPFWTPSDALDTAQAFHAELAQAERGVAVGYPKVAAKSRLFIRSRYRRARIYDGLAVALLLALMAALGVVVFAASARADIDPDVRAYAYEYGPAVCSTLDAGHATFDGLIGIGQAIVEQGLTAEQAGQVIGYSVTKLCPRHSDLVAAFVRRYSGLATA